MKRSSSLAFFGPPKKQLNGRVSPMKHSPMSALVKNKVPRNDNKSELDKQIQAAKNKISNL